MGAWPTVWSSTPTQEKMAYRITVHGTRILVQSWYEVLGAISPGYYLGFEY